MQISIYAATTCVALLIDGLRVCDGEPVYSFMFISEEKFILSSPGVDCPDAILIIAAVIAIPIVASKIQF